MRVLFDVPEVDTLKALAARTGSTLLPELRKAWSGERLGFQNRSAESCLPVAAMTYRAALVVGVQPLKAAALFDDGDGGTPQRFIWLPAWDPTMTSQPVTEPVETIKWAPPTIPVKHSTGFDVIEVPDDVRDLVTAHRLANCRGEVEPLDTHAVFAGMKTATAIALLHSRSAITSWDWQIAQTIMRVSVWTREYCRNAITQDMRRRNHARNLSRGQTQITVAQMVASDQMQRTAAQIIHQLGEGPRKRKQIRGSLTDSLRGNIDAALLMLEEADQIHQDTHGFYSLATGRVRPTTLPSPKTSDDQAKRTGDGNTLPPYPNPIPNQPRTAAQSVPEARK